MSDEAQTFTQLKSDLKDAMRNKEKQRRDTIRMLVSSLKNKQIDLGRELNEEDILSVLSTEAKKRREAADAYREGDRDELAAQEEAELAVIKGYLPKQLTDDEAADLVDEVISEVGAESKRDMGKVMGAIMPKIKGRYEGSKIKDIVLSKLD